MAPNGISQEAVVQAATQHRSKAHCVEAHGTGTALGDPIEVGALHRVLGSTVETAEPVLLGAFKSLMAHSEGAAGMAGLVKVIQVLRYHCVPPNLHLQKTNPKLDLEEFATVMPSQGVELVVGEVLLMGESSFGYSGTNAHAVRSTASSSPSFGTASVAALMSPCLSAKETCRRTARRPLAALTGGRRERM